MSVLTAVTEDPHHTKTVYFWSSGSKINQGTVIVVVDMTVTGASTDGTGFKTGLKFSQTEILMKFLYGISCITVSFFLS